VGFNFFIINIIANECLGFLRLGVNASFQNISCSNQFRGSITDTSNAPAFTWEGNENTGIYHVAQDVIVFSVDGVSKTIIGSNIGINTTSPQFPLDVNGAIRSSSNIYCGIIRTSNNPCFSWAHNSNTGIFSAGANVVGISAGGAYIMTIGSNVGIGTSNPLFRLHNALGSIFIGNAALASTTIPASSLITSCNVANGHRLVFDNSYNGTGNNYGTMVGYFNAPSSRTFKKKCPWRFGNRRIVSRYFTNYTPAAQ
jgi:hypothetical protein